MSQHGEDSTCPRSLSPESVDCLRRMVQLTAQLEEERKVAEAWKRAKAEEKVAEECRKVAESKMVQLVALAAEQVREKEAQRAAQKAEKKKLRVEAKVKEAVKKVADKPVVTGSKRWAKTPSDDEEEYEEELPVKKKARVRGTVGVTDGEVLLAIQPCTW